MGSRIRHRWLFYVRSGFSTENPCLPETCHPTDTQYLLWIIIRLKFLDLFYFFVFRVSSLWLALCNIGSIKDGKRWDAEEEHPTEVRELGKSKWSEDFEDDIDQTEGMKGNINALSGLIHQYGKERKSVHWGDQV